MVQYFTIILFYCTKIDMVLRFENIWLLIYIENNTFLKKCIEKFQKFIQI